MVQNAFLKASCKNQLFEYMCKPIQDLPEHNRLFGALSHTIDGFYLVISVCSLASSLYASALLIILAM